MQPKHHRGLFVVIISYSSFFLLFLLIFSLNMTCWSQACNNWLRNPGQASFVQIGDLDVPGNIITVEATFNRTSPWDGIDLYQGDLVSKHLGPENCNYLLRPSSAEITTTDGATTKYFKTPTICPIELNKTYHVAMVYDGSTLKFYRNGFLMSQIAASGPLFQNEYPTQIGDFTRITKDESLIGYINEVRIWNVARTQDQLKSYMSQSLPNPQSQPGLLAYYTFDNLINKQGNLAWNGTLNGSAAINQTNSSCSFVADSCKIIPTPVCASNPPDFTFAPNTCSPLAIQFKTSLSGVQSYQWELGDGLQSNLASPVALYPSEGQKSVKLKVQYDNNCKDSILKTIPLWLTPQKMILNRNPEVCYGDSVMLQTSSSKDLGFCWRTASGALNPASRNPFVKPTATTTYSFIAQSLGDNLVNNGDFEYGNVGFTTGYAFSSSGLNAGVYNVGSNMQNWYSGMAACHDHTTGNGNMLMVSGSDQQNTNVWAQPILVKPNTNYVFSAWAQSSNSVNPAQLQFSINGKKMDVVFTTDKNTCVWSHYYTIWNSGDNTSTSISIVNMNQQIIGNDFALDDLYFGELYFYKDSVSVFVNPIPKITAGEDTTICKGNSIQLSAGGGIAYKWTPSTYLSSSLDANPVATPQSSINYKVAVIGTNGCVNYDSVFVDVRSEPTFSVSPAMAEICSGDSVLLTASGGNIYAWQPVQTVQSANFASTKVFPTSTTRYKAIIEDNICHVVDSVFATVTVHPLPKLSIQKSNDIDCNNGETNLLVTGAAHYLWSSVAPISGNNIANPIVAPRQTSVYVVKGFSDKECVSEDSIVVKVLTSEKNKFFLPSAFTPNGDKINDVFRTKYWGVITEFSMSVYNRWGEKVFETNSPLVGWDGKYKSIDQPAGAYIYIVSAKTLCGETSKKGTVMLIR